MGEHLDNPHHPLEGETQTIHRLPAIRLGKPLGYHYGIHHRMVDWLYVAGSKNLFY